MRIGRLLQCLTVVLSIAGLGCQKGDSQGKPEKPQVASDPDQTKDSPPPPAVAADTVAHWDRPPMGSLPLVPGERIGEISVGMTKKELAQKFQNQVVKGIATVQASPDKSIEFLLVDGRYDVKMVNGRVSRIGVKLADFKYVNFGDKVLDSSNSLEQMAAKLPGCKEHLARGASGFNCAGVNVIRAGNSRLPQANVSVGVFSTQEAQKAEPGEAPERDSSSAQPRKPFSEKLSMEPGKRLGEITLGMTREELVRRFPDRTVLGIEQQYKSDDGAQEYLKVGGIYKVSLKKGRVDAASVDMAEFRTIDFGGKLLDSGLTMEQMAELLPNCRRLAVIGASGFTCAGAEVVRGGVPKLPQAGVSVAVFAGGGKP
ncbi:MAG: hypothetical protein JXR96_18780 [Deltaproteobacteria bacterium]|nr:hypothetical protein [Deltaproteobacteria bacterium]